jgi:serine phosphatase RsbU (regulator of sigma subunit)
MQKALLPQSLPEVPGLELAQAYESSARLEVGGDVYDFLVLADGRLAVVLGDVTGHGVDAAADMAMAKYIFRSLAREHTDPADFLASANGQRYDEVSVQLAPGDAVVLYTDGVIEARCGQELYGVARLDAVLAANAGASAEELAAAVLVDCRAYAGGELADDCALVVVKRV